jgi:hypothetical protein
MDKLPEELIVKIVAYLAPHPSDLYDISQLRDLANLPRISRRLERIFTPHLYKSVPITVCKVGQNMTVAVGAVDAPPMVFDIITTKGCNAQKFLKTLQHRPALREFVKYVSLLRDDRGFLWRLSLGCYGYSKDSSATANFHWREIEKAARTGFPISTSRILRTHLVAPVACLDEGFETVRELLRLLPKIEHLNCHKYRTDLPWHPAAETFQTLRWQPMPQNDFRSLRSLKLDCCEDGLAGYWSVFILPSIRTVWLDVATLRAPTQLEIDSWKAIESCPVTELQLHAVNIDEWQRPDRNVVHHMLKACTQLHSLSVSSSTPCQNRLLLDAVGQYCSRLQRLSIITYPLPTRSSLGVKKIFPISENPKTPFIPVFRASTGLKQLVLDVTDLLEVVKLSELGDQHTGIITPITFVMGEEILINADLTLPNSLEVLILRVSNGDKQRAGTIKALRALVLDSKARLPYLRVLRTAWQVPCTTPSGESYIGDDLAGVLETVGVRYEEMCFPEGGTIGGQPAPGPENW